MSQLERQQQILDLLKSLSENSSVSVREIADAIYSSESSVRRDVAILVRRGLLTHMYGGVMLARFRSTAEPLTLRDSVNSDTKEFLASSAAAMVKDGDVIFLDSSSTARRIPFYLKGKKDVVVITNNQRIFTEYGESGLRMYCTGGRFNEKNANFLGAEAVDYILTKHADVMFFSSQGLSHEGEITDVSEEETAIRRAMIRRATRQVFLCDSAKIGIERVNTLCRIDEISDTICDRPERIDEICARLAR